MSGHLIGCAGATQGLGKSHKLALLAFADSADDRTHIAFPGYEGVQTWADCSRSRAAELIKDLVTAGYLRLHKTARPGRRAEYVVFPHGCCDLHRTPAEEDTTVDVAALAERAGVSIEAAAALVAAMTTPPSNASEISDPSTLNGSEISDPLADESRNGSEISDPSTGRVQNASEISDPSTTPGTTTPLPPASGGTTSTTNTTGCQKPGPRPHTNCRGCGTTNRQIAERDRLTNAERRRADEQARLAAEAAQRAAAARPAPDSFRAERRRARQKTRPTR